jgi:hypothetical protein
VREVLLFLLKFLVLSAALFVGFTVVEESYTTVLAHVTAALAPLTGASIEVLGVDGNMMRLGYDGGEFTKRLIFAAFNPVILIALLLATPRIGIRKDVTVRRRVIPWRVVQQTPRIGARKLLIVGCAGLVLLLLAQVVTLRLMLSMDLLISQAGSVKKFKVLETLALISICFNWVIPIVIWVAWVPTGFLTRALRLAGAADTGGS